MKNSNVNLIVFAIVLSLFFAVVGFQVGRQTTGQSQIQDDHSHEDLHFESSGHSEDHDHHEMLEAEPPYPELSIQIDKDLKSGYNVQLVVQNFEFAPENASKSHVKGQGHAHIYVNGEKIGRVYSPWFHIEDLEPGDELKVVLSTNDHKAIAVNGSILAEVVVVRE